MKDECAALGFGSATKNIAESELKKRDNDAGKLNFMPTQLLQQVVLWNVGHLRLNNINFNPYFISSNEDVSFSRFLGGRIYACTQCTVIKLEPVQDYENSFFLTKRREQLEFLCAEAKGYQICNQTVECFIPNIYGAIVML